MSTEEQIYSRAIHLFKSGITQDTYASKYGKVESPIPIREPSNEINSWFVAITADEKIIGFIQISKNLNVMRYSTFQRSPGSSQGCPEASLWLDTDTILSNARKVAVEKELLSAPILTYDQNPSRIVWSTVATDESGSRRTINIAGEYVYFVDQDKGKNDS